MRKIKADYHFHPNLPSYVPVLKKILSSTKLKKIWKAFEKHDLDVVFVTEHSYKHPKRSFEILEKTRPAGAKTILIPGIEVLTKEGTDMIVFSKDKKDIYSHQELLTPKKFTVEDLVKFIKKHPELHGIVTHPYVPGKTGIVQNNGIEIAKWAVKELGMVEAYNCSFTALIPIVNFLKLNKILKKKYAQMLETAEAPSEILDEKTILTGGSDAHRPWQVGDYMELEIEENDDIFQALLTKSGKINRKNKKIIPLFLDIFTVTREVIMKKAHLYSIDKSL
jgi:hypothetical protein